MKRFRICRTLTEVERAKEIVATVERFSKLEVPIEAPS
jgi:hypothetical protein